MPIRKDVDAVVIPKVWFDIPVESTKDSIPLDFESSTCRWSPRPG